MSHSAAQNFRSRTNWLFLLLLGFGALTTKSAEQNQDELKRRILAQAQGMSADDYAFTRTVRTDTTSGGKTEKKVQVDKFDPTKSGDARWTLVSVDNGAPSAEDLGSYRKESAKRRVPGYYRLANYFGAAATSSTDARGRTVFHFTVLPKDTLLVLGTDVSQNAAVDASASEGNNAQFIEQVHITIRPMRIKLIAKLERYDSMMRYRLGPEGKPLLSGQTSDMSGSMMLKEGQVHTEVTYSDYRAVKKTP